MTVRRWCTLLAVSALTAVSCAGSGEGDVLAGTTPASPAAMCDRAAGATELAAYRRTDGAFRWAVCGADVTTWQGLAAVGRSTVYVDVGGSNAVIEAFDARTGASLPDGGPADERAAIKVRTGPAEPPVVDGIRLLGGQDDDTSAIDAASGEILWTHPGTLVYDDVWAVADGAVYVWLQGTIVAYELRTGATRWTRPILDWDNAFAPWAADGREVYALGRNLVVLDTRDGSTRWATDYPARDFPRMSGVGVNDDTVFVTFSWVPSGGD